MVIELINEIECLIEMSNIGPRTHRFGVDIKLNILQPGDRKIQHGPRVKIFRGSDEYYITLNKDKSKMKVGGNVFLNKKDANIVFKNVVKYRNDFLKFWNDKEMTSDELRDLMDSTDKLL